MRLILDRFDHVDKILKQVATRLRCWLIIRLRILIRCKLIFVIFNILVWCLLILVWCGIFIRCWLFVRSRSWVLLRINNLAVGLILKIELDTHALFVVITDHTTVFSCPCHNLAFISAPVPREVYLNVAAAGPGKIGPHVCTVYVITLFQAQVAH